MKKRNYILLLCILLCAAPLMAQDAPENTKSPGWYAGVQGGVPFGVSTFSSFGFDKTRAGFSGGLYGGYRFNPVLSLEAQAVFGKTGMSQRDCCISGNYWLGSDGVRYHAPVLGMEGWDYAGLKSSVTTQRYGLQLNADVLGFSRPPVKAGGAWRCRPCWQPLARKPPCPPLTAEKRHARKIRNGIWVQAETFRQDTVLPAV